MKSNWNPFFALANTRSKIDETVESRNDVSMKEISEDEMDAIQEVIVRSLEEQCEVEITYHRNKRFSNVSGVVSKIDSYNRVIIIDNYSIQFNCIIKAELL